MTADAFGRSRSCAPPDLGFLPILTRSRRRHGTRSSRRTARRHAPSFPPQPSLLDGDVKQVGQPPLRVSPSLRPQFALIPPAWLSATDSRILQQLDERIALSSCTANRLQRPEQAASFSGRSDSSRQEITREYFLVCSAPLLVRDGLVSSVNPMPPSPKVRVLDRPPYSRSLAAPLRRSRRHALILRRADRWRALPGDRHHQ